MLPSFLKLSTLVGFAMQFRLRHGFAPCRVGEGMFRIGGRHKGWMGVLAVCAGMLPMQALPAQESERQESKQQESKQQESK
ncbi:MAG: hypothetical protein MO847_08750 [Candidatus Protistobacter heckmanni]|nr:hypothetical protein [Candidatus Protistobacter heckmanni]